jgi:hypothetical protein
MPGVTAPDTPPLRFENHQGGPPHVRVGQTYWALKLDVSWVWWFGNRTASWNGAIPVEPERGA